MVTDKLLTVKQVMDIIPVGKTTATAIVKSLTYVTLNRKLMVHESSIRGWIAQHTKHPGETSTKKQPIKRKPEKDAFYQLNENGMIPTRRELQRMMAGREDTKKQKKKGEAV